MATFEKFAGKKTERSKNTIRLQRQSKKFQIITTSFRQGGTQARKKKYSRKIMKAEC